MFTPRPQSARQLLLNVGRLPMTAAVAAVAIGLPAFPAFAQAPADAAKVRDPMKPADAAKADGQAKVKVSEHMTVDLHVKDEDLANVLELLSIQTQKNIIASKNVGGKVTATLYGVTFYQALDSILHVNGFGYTENGNFIYVYTNDELKQIQAALKKRVSKVIKLNYINADDAKEFVSPLLSKDGGELKINQKTKDFTIPDKSPVGKNDYALGDTLVVFDYEENVKAIEELVKQIDTRPQQVLVEATIVQTSLNEANAFGIDFSLIGDLNFTDFINSGGPLSAANNLIKGGSGASGQGFSPTDDRGYAGGTTVGNTSGPGGFKVGVVSGDLAIFLRMLDQVTDTVVLSNPKILALNRQPARVLVGKRVGYLNTTQTETSTTQSVEFLDTGTQLYFRPFVSSEGEIRMELKPQISSAEIRTVTDSGGRAVTIPDEVTQELVTNVNVRDGQTIVLGGLFTENSTFTRRQVPVIGDIPILGAAFRGHDDSTVRSEIIFMITPSIVTDTLIAGSAERAQNDLEHIRAGTRQGLLPWSREKMTDKLNVEAEQLAREGKSEEALYKLRNSLSLNPNQPAAYRLREKITGQRENWSDPSALNSYLDKEVIERIDSVPAATGSVPNLKPKGAVEVPMKSTPAPRSMNFSPAQQAVQEMAAIEMPGQFKQPGNTAADFENGTNTGSNTGSSTTTASAPSSTEPAQPANNAENNNTNTNTNQNATAPTNEPMSAAPMNDPSGYNTGSSQPVEQANNSFNINASNSGTATIDGQTYSVVSSTPNATEPAAQPMTLTTTTSVVAQPEQAKPAASTETKPADNAQSAFYFPPELTSEEKQAASNVRSSLSTLRAQIEIFSLMNGGTLPKVGTGESNGWNELVSTQLVKEVPANTYVGGPNASKVVVGEKPDANFHQNYGWVFDPKTGKLWAVGFDSTDRVLSKTATAQANQPAQQNAQAQTPAPAQQPAQPEPATAGVETEQK